MLLKCVAFKFCSPLNLLALKFCPPPILKVLALKILPPPLDSPVPLVAINNDRSNFAPLNVLALKILPFPLDYSAPPGSHK